MFKKRGKHRQKHSPLSPDQLSFCVICDRYFSRSYFDLHTRVHTGEKPFECSICSSKFSREDTLSRHVIVHRKINPEMNPVTLKTRHSKFNLENIVTRRRSQMNSSMKHKPSFLANRQKKRTTPTSSLPRRGKLRQNSSVNSAHMSRRNTKSNGTSIQKQDGEGQDQGHMKRCVRQFSISSEEGELQDPAVTQRQLNCGRRLHTCTVCQKQYKRSDHLNMHMKAHSSSVRNVICEKDCGHQAGLLNHVRIHKGRKKHKCPVCGKRCSIKASLLCHMKIHGKQSHYKCAQCDMTFDSEEARSRHVDKCHYHQSHSSSSCGYDGDDAGELVEYLAMPDDPSTVEEQYVVDCIAADAMVDTSTGQLHSHNHSDVIYENLNTTSATTVNSIDQGNNCDHMTMTIKTEIQSVPEEFSSSSERHILPHGCTRNLSLDHIQTSISFEDSSSTEDASSRNYSDWNKSSKRNHGTSILTDNSNASAANSMEQESRGHLKRCVRRSISLSEESRVKGSSRTPYYGRKSLTCSVCKKQFKRYDHFNTHMKKHSRSVRKSTTIDGTTIQQLDGTTKVSAINGEGQDEDLVKSSSLEGGVKDPVVTGHQLHCGRKLLKCTVCQKQYKRYDHFNRHMKTHSKSVWKVRCPVYGTECGHRAGLLNHMRIHKGRQKHTCPVCGKRCSLKVSLLSHMKIHGKQSPYKCAECDMTFDSEEARSRHVHKCHSHQSLSHSKCGYDSDGAGELVGYCAEPDDRDTVEEQYVVDCIVADATMDTSTGQLHSHSQPAVTYQNLNTASVLPVDSIPHEDNRDRTLATIKTEIQSTSEGLSCSSECQEQSYVCNENLSLAQIQTNISFEDTSVTEIEASSEYSGLNKTYRPNYGISVKQLCDNSSNLPRTNVEGQDQGYVKRCLRRTRVSQEDRAPDSSRTPQQLHCERKLLTCNVCQKKYKRYDHFNTHMKTHSRPIQKLRMINGTSSMQQQYFTSNVSSTNSEEKDQGYLKKCERSSASSSMECGMKDPFVSQRQLHRGRKFLTCTVCQKQYKRYDHFNAHMKTHSKSVRKVSCPICGKDCGQRAGLHNHMRIHKGRQKHTCPVCGKICSLKASLLNHMKIHSAPDDIGMHYVVNCVPADDAVSESAMQSCSQHQSGSYQRSNANLALTVDELRHDDNCELMLSTIKTEKESDPGLNNCTSECHGISCDNNNALSLDLLQDINPSMNTNATDNVVSNKQARIMTCPCPDCDAVFEHNDILMEHMMRASHGDLQHCICGAHLADEHSLAAHMSLHDQRGGGKCRRCGFIAVSGDQLAQHIAQYDFPYRCSECHVYSILYKDMKEHVAGHNKEPEIVVVTSNGNFSATNSTDNNMDATAELEEDNLSHEETAEPRITDGGMDTLAVRGQNISNSRSVQCIEAEASVSLRPTNTVMHNECESQAPLDATDLICIPQREANDVGVGSDYDNNSETLSAAQTSAAIKKEPSSIGVGEDEQHAIMVEHVTVDTCISVEELPIIQQQSNADTEMCVEDDQPKILSSNHITESQYNAMLSEDSPDGGPDTPGNITDNSEGSWWIEIDVANGLGNERGREVSGQQVVSDIDTYPTQEQKRVMKAPAKARHRRPMKRNGYRGSNTMSVAANKSKPSQSRRVVSSASAIRQSRMIKKRAIKTYRSWSIEENKALCRYFKNIIARKLPVHEGDILKARMKYPCLNFRSAVQIRSKLSNIMLGKDKCVN